MQPQKTPPTPRRSKKKDPESHLFTSNILPVCGTPWKPTSAQLPGGPLIWRPQLMVKNIEGYPIFALDAPNPDKPPACRSTAPPSMPSPTPQRPRDVDDVSMDRAAPGSSIAPTDLWCSDESPPTARAPPPPLPSRSRRDSSPSAVGGYGLRAQITPLRRTWSARIGRSSGSCASCMSPSRRKCALTTSLRGEARGSPATWPTSTSTLYGNVWKSLEFFVSVVAIRLRAPPPPRSPSSSLASLGKPPLPPPLSPFPRPGTSP